MSKSMRWEMCVLSIYLINVGVVFGRTTNQQANPSENAYVGQNVNRGEKVKIEGLVVSRQGEILTMRTADSDNIEVTFTDYTKVDTPRFVREKTDASQRSRA